MSKTTEHIHPFEPDMLSVEDALERTLGSLRPNELQNENILDTLGLILREKIYAPFDTPQVADSAMDGYAVRYQDVSEANQNTPTLLSVIGEISAGEVPSISIKSKTAVKIMTGAIIPKGANAVVPFELTDELIRKGNLDQQNEIGILTTVGEGNNIRPAGENFQAGDLILDINTLLRPAEIGVLATIGKSEVKVVRRPIIGILATGNELAQLGHQLYPGQIYDSNTYSIASAIKNIGAIPKIIGIAKDTFQDTEEKILSGLNTDILISSAGVSKGDYDMVKDVMSKHGAIDFWSIRMRPAKPLAFGMLSRENGELIPLIGLPGNPVSAMVAFEEFCRPAILKLMGRTNFERPVIEATLMDAIHNHDSRRVFARVIVSRTNNGFEAKLTGAQGSNLLTSMSKANGLAICPEDVKMLEVGALVKVKMIDWPEDTLL